MATFRFKAVDSQGKEILSTVEAEDQAAAIAKIRAMKLTPKAIGMVKDDAKTAAATAAAPKAAPVAKKKRSGSLFKQKVKPKEMMVLTRQLATLIDAGLPLARGLRVLHRQCTNSTLKDALADMLETVETGNTFSESLANHPKLFNNLYVNMVKAGEAGGVLEAVLNRLAEFMEKGEKIKNKVKSAMTYPVVVLVAALGIVAFLLLKVIPKFQQIFDDLMDGEGMPAITAFVIAASEWVQANWYIALGGSIIGWILFKAAVKTPKGSFLRDRIVLKLPGYGQLAQKTAVARLTRTLGTLLSSGVPVLQALAIVKDTSDNQVIANAIQSVHDSVKEGEGMTAPMGACGVFPAMVVSMVEVGEETGALPEMLIRIANTYDDEVDTAVEAMTSVIEPIMIIFLAVVVGGIVIAMFMPLISIIGTIGQQQ
jgi:type IV pilus assembly protein PilC